MKKDTPVLEYAVLIAVIITALVFFLRVKTDDIDLCRAVFSGLVKGRYGVQKYIDWENLKAVGVNVGATYIKFTTEKERLNYKKAFIKNFSFGFKKVGGKLKAFTNWRIYNRDSEKTIVAADYRGKIILFTISKYGKRKLIAIQWKEADATSANNR